MDHNQLLADLESDEGVRLEPYRDSVGKLTIGIGRNLDDKGISKAEALFMLDADVYDALRDLDLNAKWWRRMSDWRMRALANMSFNLGWTRLAGFKKMLAALERRDYHTAADEALDSKWAQQVGERALRIAALFRGISE